MQAAASLPPPYFPTPFLTPHGVCDDAVWRYAGRSLEEVLRLRVFLRVAADEAVEKQTRKKLGVNRNRLAKAFFGLIGF